MAEPLIDPDRITEIVHMWWAGELRSDPVGHLVLDYLRSVLTPEALDGVGVGIVVELLPDHWVISRSVSDLHRRIFGDAG